VTGSGSFNKWARIAARGILGGLLVVAPYLLYWRMDWRPVNVEASGTQFAYMVAPVLVGAFVLTAFARGRRSWLYGAGLGLVFGALGAILYMRYDRERPQELGWMTIEFLWLTAYGVVGGLVGGTLGQLVTRPLLRGRDGGRPGRVKPWHVGAAVAVAELVLVGVALAVSW
jgi:hypothetical protein